MYNEVVLSKLSTCINHILAIEKYIKDATTPQQFFSLNEGAQYDACLMRLQALGENLKRISQKHPFVITDLGYIEIDNVIRFRDYVSHHYEQLEHEVVFTICIIKIPLLKTAITNLINKNPAI